MAVRHSRRSDFTPNSMEPKTNGATEIDVGTYLTYLGDRPFDLAQQDMS